MELHTWRGRVATDPGEALREYSAATGVALYPGEAAQAYQGLAALVRAAGLEARARRYEDVVRGVLPEEDLVRLGARHDDPVAQWAVGRHQLVTGDVHRAAGTLLEAWRLDPLDPELAFSAARAGLAADTVPVDQAAAWTEQALELGLRFHPDTVDAHLLLAHWHLHRGRAEQALEAVRIVLRFAPDNIEATAMATELEHGRVP